MWRRLRSRQLNGTKWRRQQQIGPYIVDFFCPDLRLVVEIDGDVHAERSDKDTERQGFLEAAGFQVVRFVNDDVFGNLDGVLEVLWRLTCGISD